LWVRNIPSILAMGTAWTHEDILFEKFRVYFHQSQKNAKENKENKQGAIDKNAKFRDKQRVTFSLLLKVISNYNESRLVTWARSAICCSIEPNCWP